mmetsp:Transcript_1700/g.3434  ORF Transcript_1700/g.3434 Transcript_1700/m.3434 type:complete len:256 (-) Transcript_1700:234-1001(-)
MATVPTRTATGQDIVGLADESRAKRTDAQETRDAHTNETEGRAAPYGMHRAVHVVGIVRTPSSHRKPSGEGRIADTRAGWANWFARRPPFAQRGLQLFVNLLPLSPMLLQRNEQLVLLPLELRQLLVVVLEPLALVPLPLLGALLQVGYHELLLAQLALARLGLDLAHFVALVHGSVQFCGTSMCNRVCITCGDLLGVPHLTLALQDGLLFRFLYELLALLTDAAKFDAMRFDELLLLGAHLVLVDQFVMMPVLR